MRSSKSPYVPDAEAKALAWEKARQTGARQQRPLVRDVEVARAIQQRHDDPLSLDGDRFMSDEEIAARTVQPSENGLLTFLPSPPVKYLFVGFAAPIAKVASEAVALSARCVSLGISIEKVTSLASTMAVPVTAVIELAEAFQWTSFGSPSQTASNNLVGILPNPPDAPTSINRRRHGKASVCPKHGETRGGLCRQCAR